MEAAAGVTIHWAPPGTPPLTVPCRACAAAGQKTVLLDAVAMLPRQGRLEVRLLDCPACGCAFAEAPGSYDYAGQHQADALSIATYVEAGAGLWPIVRTLARLRLPTGARFLEIGCGLGFGLDFAARARGWQARGIDPSPMAAAGRGLLGLAIENRYFGTQPEDVAADGQGAQAILASEVVEHVEDPHTFLSTLRRGLAPGGVLVLTTPDRAQLFPGADPVSLVPVLSVGAHLVLFTASGLRAVLLRAGFAEVAVSVDGGQLVAYAGEAPLDLEHDHARLRQAYRDYLAQRVGTVAAGSALWWGFAGRAYQEAVADEDGSAAAGMWAVLREACRDRFGFDPDCPETIPVLRGENLGRLADRVPKALPGLLYARALDRLHGGESLADVAGLFAATVDAAEALNAALLPLGSADMSALSARRAALAALAGLTADTATPDSEAALARAIEADPPEAGRLARRSFVGLVNAGDFAQAANIRARWDLGEAALDGWESGEPMPAGPRDTLFCLAIAALQVPGQEAVALRRFAAARDHSLAYGELWWAALRGECIAADRSGDATHATALLLAAPAQDMPADLRARLSNE